MQKILPRHPSNFRLNGQLSLTEHCGSGQRRWRGDLLLGGIWVSGRCGAGQDVGRQGIHTGRCSAGQAPVDLGGLRRSIRKGGFWFATDKGAMSADLFVAKLKLIMRARRKFLFLVLGSLPAHKAKVVLDYAAGTGGKPKCSSCLVMRRNGTPTNWCGAT